MATNVAISLRVGTKVNIISTYTSAAAPVFQALTFLLQAVSDLIVGELLFR